MTKVAFFGTSDRSIPILNSLNENFDLTVCITKMDTKVGRKQEIRETQVRKWARKNNIKCITITSTKNEDKNKVIKSLVYDNVDVGVVADFSFMIPEEIINTPFYKLINVHFSLLPMYRGASPVQFSILNGDPLTGVTFYRMDKGMDTGPIISQLKYTLKGTETSGELYKTLFTKASKELPIVITEYIKGAKPSISQDESKATYTRSKTNSKHTFVYKTDALIDWGLPAKQIERLVRAYNPWPIAWTTLGELENSNIFNIKIKENKDTVARLKIHKASVMENKLILKQVQVAGSKVISWSEFVNGYCKTK